MALGRPRGSLNAKPWQDAIRKAAFATKGGKALDRLAQALVREGEAGDVAALKEIGDRLDGKVPQAHVGENGNAIEHIHTVTIKLPAR